MPLYNNVIRQVKEEEENPGAALERAKDIGKSAIKFLGPDPDSPTFVQEVGMEFLEAASHKSPYTYIGSQILQNIPAVKAGKEVLEKSYKTILDTAFSPIKRAAQSWDDFTYMIGGGVGTGTGVGPGDIRPRKPAKRYAQPPAPEPGWTKKAQDAQYPRYQRVTPKGNRLPIAPWEGAPEIKPIQLNKGLNVNVDKMRIVTDLSDLPATQQLTFRNEVRNFLNQADKFAKKQLAYDPKNTRPLDGFEYVNLDGVNTGSRSLTDPLGRIWTVRRPTKNKGWQFKNYQDLDTYRAARTRYDITSSPEEALARRRADAYRTEQNALLKAKKEKIKNKGKDITKEERAWLKANEFIEFYGEHISRLSRENPNWRRPEFMKGTMKSGDVANYKILSNQIEKKFKDQIETILYGKISKKHYGARYGKTGNELTLGMTNDLTELTIEEILPNGRLKQLGRIPLSRAYEEGVNYKDILKEILGEPPPVIKYNYKPVGNKSIPVIPKSAAEILKEVFDTPRFPTKRDTIPKTYRGSSGLPGGG